jgi:glyoxylase-like metal-dependent hydrolase (beta-lactamase superfamily II)
LKTVAAGPTDLGDGVRALSVPYRLDGRVSSHPVSSRGFAPDNVYLIEEPGQALLIDTGYSAHEDSLIAMLEQLIEPGAELAIWSLRIGEFASISNARSIAERFQVRALYGGQGEPTTWVDFRPELSPFGSAPAGGALAAVEGRVFRSGDVLELGPGGRRLETFDAPLRLLPTNWVYDERSRTLFTEDAFTWVWRDAEEGPWTVTAEDDPTTLDGVTEYMRGSRYWWLPGARTAEIREEIAAIFEGRDIEAIAPAFGCVIRGRAAVARHLALMDEVLARMEGEVSAGVEVGTWKAAAGA